MKQSISILLILVYNVILLKPVIPVIQYHVQREAYKARCINIEKPVLQCEGTCHLQSEIKQEAAESEPVVPLTKTGIEEPPFLPAILKLLLVINTSSVVHTPLVPNVRVSPGFSGTIFHPPAPVSLT